MIKLEIVNGSLQISNEGSIILVAPKNSCAIDVLALYDETPFVVIYNKYLGNSTVIFTQPLLNCENSTGTPFTVNTFITFAETNLGFDTSGGGGATNLSTSQTATNFTINSDTGTDATVPLGNGTLAGATLNNFSNTDKTKLDGLTQVEVINDPDLISTSNTFSSSYVDDAFGIISTQKQETLVSGTNIKTVNGNSLLGSGNLTVTASTPPQSAFSVLANNTALSAVPTEFAFRRYNLTVYNQTATWGGVTSPINIVGQSYSGQQVGNMVSINIAIVYGTAGNSNGQVTLPLPTDFPTPYSPTGFTGALDVIAYGSGMILNVTTSTAVTGSRNSILRRNSTNTGYEFFTNVSVGVNAKVIIVNFTYQVS